MRFRRCWGGESSTFGIAPCLCINMTGGHDVTDDVIHRVRKCLRDIAEGNTIDDWRGHLS